MNSLSESMKILNLIIYANIIQFASIHLLTCAQANHARWRSKVLTYFIIWPDSSNSAHLTGSGAGAACKGT